MLIKRERSLNQDLVAGLTEMGPPEWPSKAGYDSIDTVSPISLDRGSVLGDATGIDTRDFRITNGDLLSQIFLERCLRHLLVATKKNKTPTIVLRPESIWQMELNCRDGLLDDIEPLSPLYEDRPGFEHFRQLALGAFLGECLVKAYDGTWSFETPASESYLEIGTNILEPFKIAARWMAAEDKEEVQLDELAKQAKQASKKSTSMAIAQDYIDPTRELSEVALGTKLAELWALYRFRLADTAFSNIAQTVDTMSVDDDAIIFKISTQWVPEFARGPQGAAILDDETVVMAYLRASGDFVALGSREGLARLMEASCSGFDQETAGRALDWLSEYHRPGWWIATSEEEAARLSTRAGTPIAAPQIERHERGATLVAEGASSEGPVQWQVRFDPSALIPWRLKVQQKR